MSKVGERKHIPRIVLVALSITILVGIAIMLYFLLLSNDGDTIKLDITVNGAKSIEFEGLALIPGEQREYSVALRSDIPGDYVLNLDFVEEGTDNDLKHYVYARLRMGDEIICDERLSDLLDGEPLTVASYLSKKEGADITITYYMPLEVGNEAENATADFMISVSSSREGK